MIEYQPIQRFILSGRTRVQRIAYYLVFLAGIMGLADACPSVAHAQRLTISPKFVSIDPAKRSATIQFFNETPDTLDSELVVTTEAPVWLAMERQTKGKNKKSSGGLLGALIDDDQPKDTNGSETIPPSQSLVPWVKNVPSRIRLAPGDTQSVNVSLNIPDDAKPGEYLCWIISRSTIIGEAKPRGGFEIVLRGRDGKQIPIPSYTKLSFTVKAP